MFKLENTIHHFKHNVACADVRRWQNRPLNEVDNGQITRKDISGHSHHPRRGHGRTGRTEYRRRQVPPKYLTK